MSKADIFSLAIIIIFVICELFIYWMNTHKTKNSEWLNMLKDFATAYVHNFKQVDIDGHEKMKNVVSAVTTTMEQHNKKVTPEDQKLIEAMAQSIYDKMINDDKKTDALNTLASKGNTNLLDAVKSGTGNAETYEDDVDETSAIDLRKDVPDDEQSASTETTVTDKTETVERHG